MMSLVMTGMICVKKPGDTGRSIEQRKLFWKLSCCNIFKIQIDCAAPQAMGRV